MAEATGTTLRDIQFKCLDVSLTNPYRFEAQGESHNMDPVKVGTPRISFQ